ncbi:MAG: hypothetical protein J7K98_01835 [Candidatus Aenigmarchaeota archaeon]|nr:hypothetical protein [Candidatus Aenigmarchaeota archaeon]
MIITKIAGALCFVLGLTIVLFGPFAYKHQPKEMTGAIVVIGILLIGLGLFLMKI